MCVPGYQLSTVFIYHGIASRIGNYMYQDRCYSILLSLRKKVFNTYIIFNVDCR